VVELVETSEPEPSGMVEYTIVSGDTLAAIAAAYGLTVADLVAANDLADPDLLFVGQTLSIPVSGDPSRPVTSTTETEDPATTTAPSEDQGIDPETEHRWIDVDLSDQLLTAYEGTTAVFTTLVSSGLPQTPTPVGQFRVWIKLRYDDMAGPGYYIEDVPFVMYFHEGYGLHGVTWHGNFGHPMSHGCVNLPTSSAEWLFAWAEVGTLVNVHA
jgi:lipoprotein-anchoring transpeptidase ErfK/SrfK